MYERHYGFTEKPFNLTPDPKYLYLSQRHTEAFAHLEFGRKEKGGFILITGEVGTGQDDARPLLPLPARRAHRHRGRPLPRGDGGRAAALDPRGPARDPAPARRSRTTWTRCTASCSTRARRSREVVLLLDEAQDLSPEVLEQIRLISNLETDTEKLIQIVLMGQSELQEMLARRELRQLAQRVTARYHLVAAQPPGDRGLHPPPAGGRGRRGQGRPSPPPRSPPCTRSPAGSRGSSTSSATARCSAGYVAGTRVDRRAAGPAGRARDVAAPPPRAPPDAAPARRRGRRGGAGARPRRGADGWPARRPPARGGGPGAPPPRRRPLRRPRRRRPSRARARGGHPAPRRVLRRRAGRRCARCGAASALERTALRTHMDQVRRLDLPAVLEMFHPGRADTCYLALLRIEGDHADRVHRLRRAAARAAGRGRPAVDAPGRVPVAGLRRAVRRSRPRRAPRPGRATTCPAWDISAAIPTSRARSRASSATRSWPRTA